MPRSLTANKMNLVGRPSVNGLSYIQKGSENRTGFKILNRKSQLCPRMMHFVLGHLIICFGTVAFKMAAVYRQVRYCHGAMQMPRVFIVITTLHYGYYLPQYQQQ